MKTKQWLIMLVSCAALAAAPLTGCGDDTDPSANNGGSNNGNNGGVDAGDTGGEDTDDGTSEPDTADGGGEDGGDTDGNELGSCEVNDFFTGQAFAEGDDSHNGGNPVEASTVTLESAGLQAVYDAVPVDDAPQDDFDTDDVDESLVDLDTTLDVTGALVIATGRTDNDETPDVIEGNDWLYLQDADTTIVLNSGFVGSAYPEDGAPAEAVKVGDKVSFTATAVRNYSGTPHVARVTDFTIDSSGADVPFTDMTGEDITMDSWGELIRVSGQLTADNGGCGGSAICYELSHGDPAETITFRSNSQFAQVGTCVTFFGPLGAFPGPLDSQGGTPMAQIDEVNWGWTFTAEPN
jgi:hypothetical protein